MNTVTPGNALLKYLIRLADDNVVLGQRLAEYISYAPELEEHLAVGNFALDHIGVANYLFAYAALVEDGGRDADAFAMLRSEREYTNLLLVEQPNEGFAGLIVRQFFFDAYQLPLWKAMSASTDPTLQGIAQRASKEATYHLRHSSGWVIRLGEGTPESHRRTQDAVDRLWKFTAEMFETDGGDTVVDARTATDWYLCGPAGMVRAATAVLTAGGVPERNIHDKLFFAGDDTSFVAVSNDAFGAEVKFTLNGRTSTVIVDLAGAPILDHALAVRPDTPFSCRSGACASCRARVTVGEVAMDRNWSLNQEEVDAGQILTCQSHPISDVVELTYDLWAG